MDPQVKEEWAILVADQMLLEEMARVEDPVEAPEDQEAMAML